jgi:hypothetical protein
MAAIDKSIYEEIFIEANDQKKTVDIRTGTVSIDYYEDIFSPTVTARLIVANTGNSVPGSDNEGNPDGPLQSIYNGLPLRGGERIALKIAGNSNNNPGLDFSTDPNDYLRVSSITSVISETQRESFVLNLVSREAITNETSRVPKKYPTTSTIDTSVKSILKDYLKTDKVGTIDKTSNKYGFIGNLRKPFTILTWLASKSVPDSSGDATAGFVFFQTKEGFHFRSIDKMITEKPKAKYTYSEVNTSSADVDQDYNILSYSTNRNQNLLEKLRLGSYASYRMFYNPLTFEFTDPEKGAFKMEDYVSKSKNLGQDLKLPKVSSGSDISLGDLPTRFITQILDLGTLEKDVSTDQNSDPFKYQSQAIMRYNVLFTQVLEMTVASNTNLRAGDIIECQFPKISQGKKNEYDDEQSGLYMIKELCHHFDATGSYTSMKLIRDTFGRHGTNTKES